MRIIAGQFKGRRLQSPPNDETRPITDRVKESLFNHLRGHIEDQNVIDLFAGTGSIGLEAISRGAGRVLFVEKSRPTADALRANIEALDVKDQCQVFVGDALGPACLSLAPRPAHLLFMDPPYALTIRRETMNAIFNQMARAASVLDDDAYLVLRTPWPLRPHMKRDESSPHATEAPEPISLERDGLIGPETHEYGSMAIHFYQIDRLTAARNPDD